MTLTFDDVADGVPAEDDTLEERRMRATSMRHLGMTWAQIGAAQNLDPAMVRRDVLKVLRGLSAQTREDMRAEQRSILRAVMRAALPAAMTKDSPNRSPAARDVLACLAAEADLCGLKAPVEVLVGLSNDDFALKMNGLLNSLDPDDRKELTHGTAPSTPEILDAEVTDDPGTDRAGVPDDDRAPVGLVDGGATEDGAADDPGVEDAPRRRPAGWSNLGTS